jgi:stage III sporulation protein AH
MKKVKLAKKNQAIIAALTLMIACAGYLNFAGKDLDLKEQDTSVSGSEAAFAENEDSGVYDEYIELNSDEDEIGEAVLTSAETAENSVAAARLVREQNRSRAKENYLAIINDTTLDDTAKQEAVDSYVKMTENMEKESEAENLLSAQGFASSMVSISEEAVEVTIGKASITEEEKAQIEDIVTRNTGCEVQQLVIHLTGE